MERRTSPLASLTVVPERERGRLMAVWVLLLLMVALLYGVFLLVAGIVATAVLLGGGNPEAPQATSRSVAVALYGLAIAAVLSAVVWPLVRASRRSRARRCTRLRFDPVRQVVVILRRDGPAQVLPFAALEPFRLVREETTDSDGTTVRYACDCASLGKWSRVVASSRRAPAERQCRSLAQITGRPWLDETGRAPDAG
jgi:membrane protein implicated in regulation of membrane protease activity